jgi:hypothetical protein
MSVMTLGLVSGCVAALFAAGTVHAQASSSQSPAAAVPGRPGVVYAEKTQTTATVEAVDKSARTVTLKTEDGRLVTLNVPPQAQNFDKIKVGDKVGAQYLNAMAVFVRKSDAPPQTGEKTTVTLAPKGEKPGGTIVKTLEMTAKVEGVNYAARTIALRGPEGNVTVLKVDDSVKRLQEVKQGDEVVVRYTEAVALTLNP